LMRLFATVSLFSLMLFMSIMFTSHACRHRLYRRLSQCQRIIYISVYYTNHTCKLATLCVINTHIRPDFQLYRMVCFGHLVDRDEVSVYYCHGTGIAPVVVGRTWCGMSMCRFHFMQTQQTQRFSVCVGWMDCLVLMILSVYTAMKRFVLTLASGARVVCRANRHTVCGVCAQNPHLERRKGT